MEALDTVGVKRESGENPEQSCCRVDGVFLSVIQPLGLAWEGFRKALMSESEDLPAASRYRFVCYKASQVWGLCL